MANAWERQNTDTQASFEAFKLYRDLGDDRSLLKVATELSKSETLLKRWSRNHNWVERVSLYDMHLDSKVLQEEEKERKKMGKRHANQSMLFQNKMLERLRTIDPQTLSANDLIKWFEVAVKVERLSRGEATDNLQHSGAVTVQIIDDLDELDD